MCQNLAFSLLTSSPGISDVHLLENIRHFGNDKNEISINHTYHLETVKTQMKFKWFHHRREYQD